MSRMMSRVLPAALGALGLILVFAWSEGRLGHRVGPEDRADQQMARWDASTAALVAERRTIRRVLDVPGTLRPLREATLSSRVLGTISEILVHEGSRVKEGEVVVRVSAPELASRSAAAREGVASAEARVAQARRDLARMEALASREAATLVEVENARTALVLGEADVARARQSAAAEAQVAGQSVLRAPFAGIVLERLADPGDQAAPGVPLLRVADDSAFRLEAAVDERDAAALALGGEAVAIFDAVSLEVPGTIDEIVPSSDATSRTQSIKLRLEPAAGLRTGLFGRLRIDAGSRDAVLVPEEAVTRSGGLTTVRLIAEDGILRLRTVRLGEQVEPGWLEVLGGLQGGERLAARTLR